MATDFSSPVCLASELPSFFTSAMALSTKLSFAIYYHYGSAEYVHSTYHIFITETGVYLMISQRNRAIAGR